GDLGDEGGDLDGDVVDVVALEELAGALGAGAGLVLPEDGLTEEVDVEAEAVAAGAGEVLGERGVVGVDDEVADDLAQAAARERDDEPGGERGGERAFPEERAVDRAEEAGGAGG